MINIELLNSLSDFDDKKDNLNYEELADNLELLEKVYSKIHNILITTRMKKLMNDFGEKESDIYVVSFPRSGTTLMQMILYQMTTNGNMEFNHIYDVSPWCRFSAIYKSEMLSVGERRIIKTHEDYKIHEQVKKGKFIFLIRDCLDTISSVYQQVIDYVDPDINFIELSNRNMRRWFDYNTEWINNKNNLDILYVNYEDLISNKKEMIIKLSDFLEIHIDDKIMERTLQRSSFEFMKKHETKFGEQPENIKVYNNFIRNGRVGEGKFKFSDEQLEQYKALSNEYKIESAYIKRYFKSSGDNKIEI